MAWMTAAGNAPFVIALLVMLGLAAVELIAVLTGFSLNDIVDEYVVPHSGVETLGDAPTGMEATGVDAQGVVGRFLAWLYIGKVPVLMVLIILLTVFGLLGLFGQGLLRQTLGFPLPGIVAAPAALLLCLPLVRACTGGLARIMPKDQTSAIHIESLLGRTALVTGGTARVGVPAQARVTDAFGTDHYVLVEPEDEADQYPSGSVVLLVRRIGGSRFSVIANPNDALIDDSG